LLFYVISTVGRTLLRGTGRRVIYPALMQGGEVFSLVSRFEMTWFFKDVISMSLFGEEKTSAWDR
jgi:hypothetical protein